MRWIHTLLKTCRYAPEDMPSAEDITCIEQRALNCGMRPSLDTRLRWMHTLLKSCRYAPGDTPSAEDMLPLKKRFAELTGK